MRISLAVVFLLLVPFGFSQKLDGVWQGMLVGADKNLEKANVIYLSIAGSNEQVTGLSRIEILNRSEFALKQFTGKMKDTNSLILTESNLKNASYSRQDPKCKLTYTLQYDDSTGYLTGDYVSTDCRNKRGTIVLYRSKMKFNEEKEPTSTHLWKGILSRDYKKGYPSPEIREKERDNFQFQPIYFDHDKSEIKPEFHEYLNRLARVLDGHSDLRMKVTGHTDAVGTDAYNIGLSERRAKAIIDYFLTQGIPADKLEFDFKGKRVPVASNNTSEGKQLNRRVDFEFI